MQFFKKLPVDFKFFSRVILGQGDINESTREIQKFRGFLQFVR